MSVKVKKHSFEYNGQKYFRGNAHLLELGSWGDKKDPIGAKAYVDPAGKIRAKHLADRPIKTSSHAINWNSVSEAEFDAGADLKFFGLGRKHAVAFSLKDAKKANLKLMNVSIAENPLKRCLNNDANTVRNGMADEGSDARIVGEAWIVVDAELAEYIDTRAASENEWSALGNSLELNLSGGAHKSQTIEIGAGTTFAYKLYKVKKWGKGKDEIEDLEADYKGMG